MMRKTIFLTLPIFLILSFFSQLVVATRCCGSESQPYVLSTEPANGSVNISLDFTPKIIFSSPMNKSSVQVISVPKLNFHHFWHTNNTVLELIHQSNYRRNTSYTIYVLSGTDTAGNELVAFKFSFKTANSSNRPLSTAGGENEEPEDLLDDIWNGIQGIGKALQDLGGALADGIKNLPGLIWDAFMAMINNAVGAVVGAVILLLSCLLTQPDNLYANSAFTQLYWDIVLFVDAALGIVFVIIGIMYMMSGARPELKARLKNVMPSLLIMLVLAHFSIFICQTALDIANAATEYVLISFDPSSMVTWQSAVNGWVLIVFMIVFLLIALLVLILLAVRFIAIFFCTALMPLALVLYPIPQTSWFSRNIFMMFVVMTFLNFFAAVLLRLGLMFMSNVGVVGGFLMMGALILIVVLPSLITRGVSALTGVQTSLTSMAMFPIAAGTALASAVVGGVKGFAAARAAGSGFLKAATAGFRIGMQRFAAGQYSGLSTLKLPTLSSIPRFSGLNHSNATGTAPSSSRASRPPNNPVVELLKAHLSAPRGRKNPVYASLLRNRNLQAHIYERNNRVNAIRHWWHIENDIERPRPAAAGGGA